MEIVVRRAVAQDAPSLARLRWRWQVEEWHKVPAIDQESFVDFFTSWTLDHLNRYAIFMVQVDGRLGGMAWLSLTDRVPSPSRMDRRGGDIQSVYVLPELRGSGAGAPPSSSAAQAASMVPNAASSRAAVAAPKPRTPGRLSDGSPRRAA